MAYTGGPLNELNGKMGFSATYKSVAVMKLIRYHKPKSKDELVELIKWHSENECECGIKSKGSVESFGKNLYESQLQYWGEYKFSLQECVQREYDLFVVQSLKGDLVENRAKKELSERLSQYEFCDATGYMDEELRIDIIVSKNNQTIAGIQVKPATFKMMRREVIAYNRIANSKWEHPVFYLYYDENETFLNMEEIISEIKKI